MGNSALDRHRFDRGSRDRRDADHAVDRYAQVEVQPKAELSIRPLARLYITLAAMRGRMLNKPGHLAFSHRRHFDRYLQG